MSGDSVYVVNIYDLDKLRDLMEQAAESLIGHKFSVVFKKPVYKEFIGQAFIDTQDVSRIEIDPKQPIETIFHCFLHEVGHFFYEHVSTLEEDRIDYQNLPSDMFQAFDTTEKPEAYSKLPVELEADSFANQIGNYAQYKAISLFGHADIETKLRVLCQVTILKPGG